jgi:hypothetical protein
LDESNNTEGEKRKNERKGREKKNKRILHKHLANNLEHYLRYLMLVQ